MNKGGPNVLNLGGQMSVIILLLLLLFFIGVLLNIDLHQDLPVLWYDILTG